MWCDIPANTKHLYGIVQRRPDVFDAGPTLYKCVKNVLCLLVEAAALHLQIQTAVTTYFWREVTGQCSTHYELYYVKNNFITPFHPHFRAQTTSDWLKATSVLFWLVISSRISCLLWLLVSTHVFYTFMLNLFYQINDRILGRIMHQKAPFEALDLKHFQGSTPRTPLEHIRHWIYQL